MNSSSSFLSGHLAHSHVDDYSRTLGGVRNKQTKKVHVSALVTSPEIVALSQVPSQKTKTKTS